MPLTGCGGAEERGGRPSFETEPATVPGFAWDKSDYVIRCEGGPVRISIDGAGGWTTRIQNSAPRGGDFTVERPVRPNESATIQFSNGGENRSFHVRCLPRDFPDFEATGPWRSAPRLTLIQLEKRYAVALDRHGTPVWWQKTPEGDPGDAKFLRDGTFAYAPVRGIKFRHYVIRRLDGTKVRVLTAGGGFGTDSHDLQLLGNGNYLIGSHRLVRGVDTSRFGGATGSTIDTARVQEMTPGGRVVWSWNAYPRVRLGETGRWWKVLAAQDPPFDVHHWNSIARRGNLIMLSFRHLDAVYGVDRRTGRILWKLGGTRTRHSLRVVDDPRKYPLGGQHDARFLPDGSITIFDNATNLPDTMPRAVRYRLDLNGRTATLLDEVTDPDVPLSVGFGSARLANGTWTVGWGAMADGVAGIYSPDDEPSRFLTPGGASYRANPVYGPRPSIARLRASMNRVASRMVAK